MTEVVNDLLTEKLRPQTVAQCILKNSARVFLQNLETNGLTMNLLFYGNPGTGKTTLSRILSKPYPTLELNCSALGIDAVRLDIQEFASQVSLLNEKERIKVVMLEECDGFTPEAWAAFRNVFEKYTTNVRFVANCNNINKIPPAIKSRFTCISLEPQNQQEKEEMVAASMVRVGAILKAYGIKYTEAALRKFILIYFPDMRTIINEVGKLYSFGHKELTEETLSQTFDFEGLFKLILSDDTPVDIYKAVRDGFDNREDEAIIQIGMKFPDYLRNSRADLLPKIPLILIYTAEYMHALPTSLNKKITLEALVFKLQQVLKAK